MKKLIALLIAVLMVLSFSLVSCNKDEGDDSNSTIESSSSESSSSSSSEESSSEESSTESDDTGSTPTTWESTASAEVQLKVEELLQSKHKLTYNEDGSFRVAIFADMHIDVGDDLGQLARAKENIKKIVDEQKPNLVVFTGDNIINSSNSAKARQNINAIVSYLEEKKIPWCHVYGNHDHENSISKEAQQAIYESYEYCISKTGPDLSGVGNYVHGVYKSDGSLGAVLYCIDSGAYVASGSGHPGYYDFIKEDQIDWYEETSSLLQEYNNGKVVHGIMAFHIPLVENRDANANKNDKTLVYEYSGGVNEGMCPSEVDTELLETIWERGDIKAIVTGHDHKNDYMFNYKGVKLTSSPTISEMGYYDSAFMGSRIFDLNASTITDVPTYVAYLIKRFNPDDFDALDSNISAEDFEGTINAPIISGYASSALNGTASTEVVAEKGVNSSSALEVKRSDKSNFEFVMEFNEKGKVGDNKYIIVWMDLTNIEFRKACIGLYSSDGTESPYRTDDNDYSSPKFYYLADNSDSWVQLSHGWDGCFGPGDGGAAMIGRKGYFAFAIDDLRQASKAMTKDTLVAGFYFYGSLESDSYVDIPFYIDSISLVEDYTTFER